MVTEPQPTMVLDGMVGKTIGNYIVRHKLGEGGMGSVYVAEHPSIGKRVALKVLQAEFASQPEIVSRFFNEAKAVNDIQHPNIVDIVDFGTIAPAKPTDPPTVYFIMEYIVGSSLSDLIRREAPLRPDRAIAIALQVADALSASHRMGIVHRDLKPDNVMLVSRGREQDFVKLLDFGIAKLTGNAASTHRTRTGMVIGTPQYMSPEQCEGRNIDHRTDIYALGIVLYQMLTGKVPFAGDGFGEVLIQQMAMPPLAPSAIVPLISEYLELVVLKALEKRADHRYQRMDDMTLALQDPMQYVESHGGRGGFVATSIVRDPSMLMGASAAVVMLPLATNRAAQPTTLGGSAAQLTGAAPPKRRTSIVGRIAVAGAGVAAACVVVAVMARGGDDPVDRIAAPHSSPMLKPEPKPATNPEPAPIQPAPAPIQPAPAPVQSAAPPPVTATAIAPKLVKTVRVTVDSTPVGATVTIGGGEAGRTPYVGELDRGDTPVEIKLTLAGYVPVTKKVNPKDNVALSLLLVRARRVGPRPIPVAPVNAVDPEGTKNPFDRLGKKEQP